MAVEFKCALLLVVCISFASHSFAQSCYEKCEEGEWTGSDRLLEGACKQGCDYAASEAKDDPCLYGACGGQVGLSHNKGIDFACMSTGECNNAAGEAGTGVPSIGEGPLDPCSNASATVAQECVDPVGEGLLEKYLSAPNFLGNGKIEGFKNPIFGN